MKIANLLTIVVAAAVLVAGLAWRSARERTTDPPSVSNLSSAADPIAPAPAPARTEARATPTIPAPPESSPEGERDGPAMIAGVVMSEDRRPLAGAHVFGHGVQAKDGRSLDTRSGADGTFSLPRPGTMIAGSSALLVVQEGFAPAELPVSQLKGPLEVVLSRGRSIRGHVRDAHGRPIEGGWVAWLPLCFAGCWGPGSFPFDSPRLCRTATDGSYQLENLSEVAILVATGPEHAAGYGKPSAGDEVDFALPRVGTITGEVTDAITGAPLDGVLVGGAVTTGPDGRFVASANAWSFSEVATLCSFAKEGYAPARQSLGLPRPGEIVCVRLCPLAHLTGRVVDVDGAPVAGATVNVQCAYGDWPSNNPADTLLDPGLTARDGSFAIEVAAGIPWNVKVTPPGMPEQTCARVQAAPGEHLSRELVVGGGRKLHGVVRASDSGEPIEGAGVTVAIIKEAAAGRKRLEHLARASTDAEGRFSFRGLSDESAWLIASGRGRARHAELVSLATTGDLEVSLDEALTIEGDLVDPEGKPLAHQRVRLQPELPEPLLTAIGWEGGTTDERGHVRFVSLGARPYRLSIVQLGVNGNDVAGDGILVEPPITNGRWVLRAR